MSLDIKICGLKTDAAVAAALDGGATHIGFIFFAKSPRNIDPAEAGRLRKAAAGRARAVAVTVNADNATLDSIVATMQPDLLQLHGHETVERIAEVKMRFGLPVIKAFALREAGDLDQIIPYAGVADLFLFDAKPPKGSDLPGGNGVSFDWQLLSALDGQVPYMLSGGLNAGNIAEALAATNAHGIDISSGVESAPGVKDVGLIRNFFSGGARRTESECGMTGSMVVDKVAEPNSFKTGPDEEGMFGIFGGRFVAETLMPLILELQQAYDDAKNDPTFKAELQELSTHYAGRPSKLYYAEGLTRHLRQLAKEQGLDGGAKIYFKREDLNHTGSHKINNCLGQILLAKRMGKTRIIAETGAGQHGVASATVSARFGLPCVVYMGATDVERQKPNVFRMKLLGAEVKPVSSGHGTLKDAMNEALRDWVSNVDDTYYLIGTAAGPHPYPELVRDFQSVIGTEAREQILQQEGRLPDTIIAAVGGGSNAIGLFHPFLDDKDVEIIGIEAGGRGLDGEEHCASMSAGRPGVLHGNRTYLLQNADGQILDGHSVSAGLDYPGVGPEHSWLRDTGRVSYVPVLDNEALDAFTLTTRTEGIIPALESAHAIAHAVKIAPQMAQDKIMIVNLSGRGDKDVHTVGQLLGMDI